MRIYQFAEVPLFVKIMDNVNVGVNAANYDSLVGEQNVYSLLFSASINIQYQSINHIKRSSIFILFLGFGFSLGYPIGNRAITAMLSSQLNNSFTLLLSSNLTQQEPNP